ncbi:piggyBac transposable element-derived protein 3 [Biomphalaria pfeifferi]|uniref:PiggyBac transposable element-derived protein 3 n=1 Tax=Biomphalaria pfeifferi TaxID=112525 RepID=A0AAD8BW72_BIOPF|nr:piggyBac transposable element-derived protein 3 [Biomphalaria pfeifferi]
MQCFIGVLLLSGYTVVPRRRMYWSLDQDVRNEAVAKAMSRNRFDEILRYFHPADNENLPEGDRFGKVRTMLTMLNERWMLYRPQNKELSIDESMIPYFGRHGAKQHIHGKPIRFGFKMWALTTSTAYLIQAVPYQGASTGKTIPELGMGGSVVMDLISELPRSTKYNLYFDSLFTSLSLMDRLTKEGFGATGTLRSSRTEKAPIIDQKVMSKKVRGSFDYMQDKLSGCLMVRWHDNSVVTVLSNCHSIKPIGNAKRWSNKEKKSILVDQPNVIFQYNRYMGGVDRLDQNIATYRISIRSKKWWWPVVSFLLSASVNNAWMLYRLSPSYASQKLDLLEFTRRIANCYLQRDRSHHTLPSLATGQILPEVRFDGVQHIIESIPKQRRCGECGKKVKRQCMKCHVALHVDCFARYHSK